MELEAARGAGAMEMGPEGGGGRKGGEELHEPGYGWKNKKAQEDWGRALEMVLDRGFSLRECRWLFMVDILGGSELRNYANLGCICRGVRGLIR